jgi:hypothetical protein
VIVDDSDKGRVCTTCGSVPVMAISAGLGWKYVEVSGGAHVLVRRGAPDVCWCLKCWELKYGVGQTRQPAGGTERTAR